MFSDLDIMLMFSIFVISLSLKRFSGGLGRSWLAGWREGVHFAKDTISVWAGTFILKVLIFDGAE
jgi:hypothetical protein